MRWALLLAGLTLAIGPAAGQGSAAEQAPPREVTAAARLTPEDRERFASAVQQYRAGDWRAAAAGFAAAGLAPTPIPEYALFLQADSLARLDDAEGAAAAATQAVDRAPDGPLVPAALLLAGDQALRAGKSSEAATLLRRFADRYPDHAEVTRARFLLAQALQASGQPAEAAKLYRQIWIQSPASAFGDPASVEERALADRGVPLAPASARDRLERAERLISAARAASARAEVEVLLGEGLDPDLALRALRTVAEASRRAGKQDAAARAVDRALGLAQGPARAPWYLERARMQQRQNREAALATLARLVRELPKTPEAPEALLLSARLLEEAGRLPEAEAVYLRVAAEYAEDGQAGAGLWQAGWLAWQRGAPAAAAERWGQLLKIRGGQAYREPVGYWIGRAHEARGDREAADRQYATVMSEAPRSYYGILASARLGGRPAAVPAAAPRSPARASVALPAEPLDLLRSDPGYLKAEALRAVALSDFAEGEVEALGRRVGGDPVRLYGVAAAHVEDARYHLALRILRREFGTEARNGDASLPRTFWEMFYPLGWRTPLEEAASRAALDPMLVAAVVREESAFFPKARSRVGARGLMQLMPGTARPMARQRGLDFRDGGVLDEPEANLDMGASFLANLVRQFGDPRLAVAAYNAGPGRVREWLAARRPDDLEVWVELIPFNETRAFVKRVMLSWDEYRRLYAPRP